MSADPGTRILVIDDEPNVLETIAAILAQEGYAVETARNPEEGLARLERRAVDVVLTDLRMEGSSGLSLIAELRQRWPDTAAIMLTGYASLESAIEALREGAYDYLIKPCHVEELRATVARAAERAALTRSLRERVQELDAANSKLQAFSLDLQQRVEQATEELTQKVQELAHAKATLEELQKQREEFISMIAHDLSQPLTTIGGYAQLLGRANMATEARERARNAIVSEARRLARLVQDLADASRLAAGRFQVNPARCDLRGIVREQVEVAQMSTDKHVIHWSPPDEAVEAGCDPDRMAQVISNLLSNAIKYSPQGKIEVQLGVEADQAVLSVRDEGPGIPSDRLEAIFEPYARLNSGRANGGPKGAGLGLFISRGIVEAHQGRIWAESLPGQGATFRVSLPLSQPQSNDVRAMEKQLGS